MFSPITLLQFLDDIKFIFGFGILLKPTFFNFDNIVIESADVKERHE